MSLSNAGDQGYTDKPTNTQNWDNRVAAADQGIAIRGPDQGNLNIEAADAATLQKISADAVDLLKTFTGTQANLTQALVGQNSSLAQSTVSRVADLQATNLTGGATDLMKTILWGLALGLTGMYLLRNK